MGAAMTSDRPLQRANAGWLRCVVFLRCARESGLEVILMAVIAEMTRRTHGDVVGPMTLNNAIRLHPATGGSKIRR
jgi:hypothetical protein